MPWRSPCTTGCRRCPSTSRTPHALPVLVQQATAYEQWAAASADATAALVAGRQPNTFWERLLAGTPPKVDLESDQLCDESERLTEQNDPGHVGERYERYATATLTALQVVYDENRHDQRAKPELLAQTAAALSDLAETRQAGTPPAASASWWVTGAALQRVPGAAPQPGARRSPAVAGRGRAAASPTAAGR